MNKFIKDSPYLATFILLVVIFTLKYLITLNVMRKQVEKEVDLQLNGGE